jgi:Zn-dependent protease with chaperone function
MSAPWTAVAGLIGAFVTSSCVLAATDCAPAPQAEMAFNAESGQHRLALSQLDSTGVLSIPELDAYYNEIAARLLAKWPTRVTGLKVYVIDSPKEVAYTDPVGAIYVSWRVVDWLQSDDEIAALLAHEISHVLLKHSLSTDRSKWFSGLTNVGMTVAAVAGGNVVPFAAADLANYSVVAPFWNRKEELQADRVGMQLLASAGYKPYAMRDLIEKIGTKAPESEKWITSEPINEKQKRYQIDPKVLFGNLGKTLGLRHPLAEVRLTEVSEAWEKCHGNTKIRPYERTLLDRYRVDLERSSRLKEIRLANQAYEQLQLGRGQEASALVSKLPGPPAQWQVPTRVLASWVWTQTGHATEGLQVAEPLLLATDAPLIFLSGPLMYRDQMRDVPGAYALARKIREGYDFSALFYPLLLRSYKRQQNAEHAAGNISVSNAMEFEITGMQLSCMKLDLLSGQCQAGE